MKQSYGCCSPAEGVMINGDLIVPYATLSYPCINMYSAISFPKGSSGVCFGSMSDVPMLFQV